jgi:hypothetical protein
MAEFSRHMKRWAILTILFYATALLVLTVPVLWIAFNGWTEKGVSLHNALKIYLRWGYWFWLAVLVAGQALLLLLPIHIAERRLPARRPLKIPVIVTAFFLANLCVAGLLSILMLYFQEDGIDFFGYFLPPKPNRVSPTYCSMEFGAVVVTLAFWIIWAIVFRSFAKADAADALLKRLTRWLLRGSILELLIAVPSHIIVRRRGDCCAPMGTFWGIVTGISVMLLCFGPGVYFLFVERCQRLQAKPASSNDRTGQE